MSDKGEVRSDIEIARAARTLPVGEIGAKLDIPGEHLFPFGHDKAKIGSTTSTRSPTARTASSSS